MTQAGEQLSRKKLTSDESFTALIWLCEGGWRWLGLAGLDSGFDIPVMDDRVGFGLYMVSYLSWWSALLD